MAAPEGSKTLKRSSKGPLPSSTAQIGGPLPCQDQKKIKDDSCKIGPYGKLKPGGEDPCPKNHDAHHVPPDYVFRYGKRTDDASRMPGMPSMAEGLAICLPKDEHIRVHRTTDAAIVKQGSDVGYAPLKGVLASSTKAVADLKNKDDKVWNECMEKLEGEIAKKYKHLMEVPVRTTRQPPGDPRDAPGSNAEED